METVRRLAASGVAADPCPYIRVGQYVRVSDGPMEGMEGVLVREKGRDRIVITVSLLMRSVIVEVERSWIEPIEMRLSRLA